MRLLLDECIPARLGRSLPAHKVVTVVQAGWPGVKNGRLLALAAADFNALVTVDRSLPYQQNTAALPGTVVVLDSVSNDLPCLLPLLPELEAVLASAPPGSFRRVSGAA